MSKKKLKILNFLVSYDIEHIYVFIYSLINIYHLLQYIYIFFFFTTIDRKTKTRKKEIDQELANGLKFKKICGHFNVNYRNKAEKSLQKVILQITDNILYALQL